MIRVCANDVAALERTFRHVRVRDGGFTPIQRTPGASLAALVSGLSIHPQKSSLDDLFLRVRPGLLKLPLAKEPACRGAPDLTGISEPTKDECGHKMATPWVQDGYKCG